MVIKETEMLPMRSISEDEAPLNGVEAWDARVS